MAWEAQENLRVAAGVQRRTATREKPSWPSNALASAPTAAAPSSGRKPTRPHLSNRAAMVQAVSSYAHPACHRGGRRGLLPQDEPAGDPAYKTVSEAAKSATDAASNAAEGVRDAAGRAADEVTR